MNWLRSARDNASALLALSRAEVAYLLSAIFLVPFMALHWRLRGLKATQRRWAAASAQAPHTSLFKARTIARAVRIACRYVYPGTRCLTRSLVLWALLRREGIPAEVCIGARRSVDQFEAHAWVELDGIILNDRQNVRERFVALSSHAAGSDKPVTRMRWVE